ncbi:hypothetical protein Scep_015543 [Stephania cephalantha]|uniref:MORF/ORRM1/DAG-like MORF domain-containing protein n=1 Tax=Stephania cephalantha TaxID=152367 RepID=A0AAP0P0G9_9MAGN
MGGTHMVWLRRLARWDRDPRGRMTTLHVTGDSRGPAKQGSDLRGRPGPSQCLFSASHLAPPSLNNGGIKLGFNAGLGVRGLAMRSNDSSNRPPKETILLDGCDFEHWLVVVEPPDPNLTRDEIIDSYIKTLAQVVGSEEEARMKIYSVSTKHYFAFGALVSEELSYKIKGLI